MLDCQKRYIHTTHRFAYCTDIKGYIFIFIHLLFVEIELFIQKCIGIRDT